MIGFTKEQAKAIAKIIKFYKSGKRITFNLPRGIGKTSYVISQIKGKKL